MAEMHQPERLRIIPLVDSRIVAQAFALQREVGHPRPLANDPIIPHAQAYGSVLRDASGQWRMWYLGSPQYTEYYAASEDGLHWRCPELDLVSPQLRGELSGPNAFMGINQKDERGRWLVGAKGPEGFAVLDASVTPHPAAKARFTALYLARTDTESGMYVAHSEDGIHWRAGDGNPVITGWRDSSSTLFYDPRIKRYVWYGRPGAYAMVNQHANRLIARRESEDLIHWTPDWTVMDTDDADADPFDLIDEAALRAGSDAHSAQGRAAAWAALTEGQRQEAERPLIRGRNRQWYGITAFPYADLYLGLAWLYDVPSGELWSELVHSTDGIDWRREATRVPFIPRIPGSTSCTMASPPVPVGDELWIYDSVKDRNHHGVPNPHVTSGIRVMALRRDRWVGYRAGAAEGELLTQAMARPGALRLNAAVEPDGVLLVEVTDAEGRPLPGLTLEECQAMSGDSLDLAPCWRSGKTLQDITDSVIRLRIRARRATVYAMGV